MARVRSRAHHELAQQLDLARRERGLSTKDLARELTCDSRSVRRYVSGERRPNRQLVEAWERACHVDPGTLTAFHDRASGLQPAEQEATASEPWSPRLPVAAAAVAAALLLGTAALVLLLRNDSGSDGITRVGPQRADITHDFKPTFQGQVWFRVKPAAGNAGKDHRVRIRWGPKQNTFRIQRLSSAGQALFLRKGDDDTTFVLKVEPPAAVEFGEGDPPGEGERQVPSNWTKRTSG